MGDTIIHLERDRSILERARIKFANKLGVEAEKLQPSYLRVAVLADPSKTNYAFNLKKDVGIALQHDRKLDANDAFIMTDLGIMLLGEDPTKPGTGLLQTYPNNTVFPAEAANVTPAHLNLFYNGSIQVKIGDRVFIDALPTDQMLHVDTTQQSAAGNFSQRSRKNGFVPLTPDVMLNGSGQNELTLNVPNFAGAQIQYVTAATRIYVTLVVLGFLVKGGSSLGASSN